MKKAEESVEPTIETSPAQANDERDYRKKFAYIQASNTTHHF